MVKLITYAARLVRHLMGQYRCDMQIWYKNLLAKLLTETLVLDFGETPLVQDDQLALVNRTTPTLVVENEYSL